MYERGSRRLATWTPGATRSGLRTPLPLDENAATLWLDVLTEPLVSDAPTAITYGSMAGSAAPPLLAPPLPPAATTTITFFHPCSAPQARRARPYDRVLAAPDSR